jgi:polyisoprenoid-binding protein YceI
MKTINHFTAVMALIFATSFAWSFANEPDKNPSDVSGPAYSYNMSESKVFWEGSKPGGTHVGTIGVVNGKAITNGDQIVGGTFELDMTSIQNEDVDNEGRRKRLLDHLRSEDFFHVDQYPVSTFQITSVEPTNEYPSTHMITGDLTIRGNTRAISFPAEINMDDRIIHARSGEIVLDRTQWDVNHKSRSIFAGLKDSYIDDEMVVRLDVYLDRNQ